MKITIEIFGKKAILNEDGNWTGDDPEIVTLLDDIKNSKPADSSVAHPLTKLAEWSASVFGGKVLGVEGEDILREGAVY